MRSSGVATGSTWLLDERMFALSRVGSLHNLNVYSINPSGLQIEHTKRMFNG